MVKSAGTAMFAAESVPFAPTGQPLTVPLTTPVGGLVTFCGPGAVLCGDDHAEGVAGVGGGGAAVEAVAPLIGAQVLPGWSAKPLVAVGQRGRAGEGAVDRGERLADGRGRPDRRRHGVRRRLRRAVTPTVGADAAVPDPAAFDAVTTTLTVSATSAEPS